MEASAPMNNANNDDDLGQRILDTALELAEYRGWEAVRLHDVAGALQIDLDTVRRYYPEKEALVEAWFDRADAAMLNASTDPELALLGPDARLHRLIMTWLEALAPHRRVTREMLWNKLEPGHLHVQIPAVLRISRTVQWLREAAGRRATFLWRALEETGLTSIYLTTFLSWLRDESPDAMNTERLLSRLLRMAQPMLTSPLFDPRLRRGPEQDFTD
jgi:AcrR family transcriptional regulator